MKNLIILQKNMVRFALIAAFGILCIGLSLAGCQQPTGGSVNQTPVADDYTIGNLIQTAGSVTAVTITPKADKSTGTITIYYDGSTALPAAAGEYAVTFDVAAATGWNAASGLYAGTLTINPQNQTPASGDYTIGNLTQTAGSVTAVTITAKAGKSAGTITIYYNGSTTLPTAAGTYVVTFDVAAASGWNGASGLSAGTLTVNPAETANQPPVAGDYTISNLIQTAGSVTAVTITAKAGKSAGTITIYYAGSTALPATAGEYAVTFDVAAATGWNAASGLSAGTLTINPKVITFVVDAIPAQTYTGSALEPTVTVKDGTTTLTLNTDYTVECSNNTNAGTATVTVTGAGNYAGSTGSRTFTINKALGAAVNAPVLDDVTTVSITIEPVSPPANGQTVEYAISRTTIVPETGWQTDTLFDELNPGTTYYIFARAAEDDNCETGSASDRLTVTTLVLVSESRFEYYWVNEHGSLVTTSGGITTITVGATLTITAQGTGYTVKQWQVNGNNVSQSGNTYTFSSLTAGEYTVGLFVEKSGKLYNTNITITVTPASVTDTLTLSAWSNGNITPTNGQQWFKFTATDTTQYIHAGFGTLAHMYVQVYDSNFNAVGARTNLYGGITSTSRTLTAGQVYYVRVTPYGPRNGTYQIAYNASSETPNAVKLTSGYWADGNIPSSGGEQWFGFTATANTQYIFVSPGTLADMYVQVYDSNSNAVGTPMDFTNIQSGNYRYRGQNLTAGQMYFLKVTTDGSHSGAYRIAFSTSTSYPQ